MNLRSSRPEVFCKKDVLENFEKNIQENTYARVYFLIKLKAWGLLKLLSFCGL